MSVRRHTFAILWVQWRSFVNHSPVLRKSIPLTAVVMAVWYGLWVVGALGAAGLLASAPTRQDAYRFLVPGLLIVTLYWQIVPVLMASSGASLDLRRLIVYPIPHRELFHIEVALRMSAAVEVMILCVGAAGGALLNRVLPWSSMAGFVLFLSFNLFLSSAVRDLLGRLMSRKYLREVIVLAIVLLSALPQVFVYIEPDPRIARYLQELSGGFWWPWAAAAGIVAGVRMPLSLLALLAWCGGAWWLARTQFERSLVITASELRSRERAVSRLGFAEVIYGLPSRVFPDPLAVMVEKEVRSMSRCPRFRLVFIMAFTFSLLIWLPMGYRREEPNWMSEHYLTVALGYAVLLLGEVMIWNVFGFDRSSAQVYFALPVSFSTVFVAKNASALFFVLLDAVMVVAVCFAVGLRPSLLQLGEAFSVMIVMAILLIAIGNVISVRNPRPIDPDRSWGRRSAGKVQAILIVGYPLLMGPIFLAFLARHAFDSEWAFYGVLAFDLVLAGILYWVGFESALETAAARREEILATLSQDQGILSN
jgi:ABC-2 type transport system permease protein